MKTINSSHTQKTDRHFDIYGILLFSSLAGQAKDASYTAYRRPGNHNHLSRNQLYAHKMSVIQPLFGDF